MNLRSGVLESRNGFALVTALIVFAVLSSLATAIMVGSRNAALTTSSELRILTARHLADAGLVRLIASVEDPNDDMLQKLRTTSHPLQWTFSGGTIELSMIPESGKIDMNASDPELLRRGLRIAVKDERRAEEITRSVLQARERKQAYTTPLAVLSARERLLPVASRIRSMFTVMTHRQGIDPSSASSEVLRSLPGITDHQIDLLRAAQRGAALPAGTQQIASYTALYEPELPIYTLLAVASMRDGTLARRQATITVNPQSRQSSVVAWEDLSAPLDILEDIP